MLTNSIIKKTNQQWKAIISFFGLIIGGATMFIGIVNLNEKNINLILIGIAIGLASFLYSCFAIRCPSCKSQWVWSSMRNSSLGQWLPSLLNNSHCPKCNYSGNV